ncbi:ATP-binding protein [Exiguobacterium sp. ERU656]|uniref:ATP-binding protein n=1 Tax=Exiguobacterium sp. ERU656 TaxID=2751217 RepID=UPI001BEB36DF|nr:ATP-binding protein [Exiguobacterium sp. ERU656]
MKLEKIIIENFRSYKSKVELEFKDLTTIIGKNDAGKSTILEALEIFFNNSLVKIDSNDSCKKNESTKVLIGCVFSNFPKEIVLDESAITNFQDEYLLNENNLLEIHKVYDCSKKTIKPEIYLNARYPKNAIEDGKCLIQLTQTELKRKLDILNLKNKPTDLRVNHLIRKNIFENINTSELLITQISLSRGDSGTIWDKILPFLPIYSLFQSDRPSLDGDSEIQDPMKLAVKEALVEVRPLLNQIEKIVREKALSVANDTLDKLREMDSSLANELHPKFSEEPKWHNIFKLSLDGDEGIPINKRGSGVRRLILLNFFRAAAERKEVSSKNIIYGIEEPETAQHPSNQRLIADSLISMSRKKDSQIILTTHIPAFASLMPIDSIRLIVNEEHGNKTILNSEDDENVLQTIVDTLGIIATPQFENIKIAVFVEGPHDVNTLKTFSSIIAKQNPEIVDLQTSKEVVIIPCGGGTLQGWVENRYLKELSVPEIHIYDRDENEPPKYEKWCKLVRDRNDGSVAYLTSKRELENYIHPSAIKEYFKLEEFNFQSTDNVPKILTDLTPYNESNIKKKLNSHVVKSMTYDQIKEIDIENEIEGKWLKFISQHVLLK